MKKFAVNKFVAMMVAMGLMPLAFANDYDGTNDNNGVTIRATGVNTNRYNDTERNSSFTIRATTDNSGINFDYAQTVVQGDDNDVAVKAYAVDPNYDDEQAYYAEEQAFAVAEQAALNAAMLNLRDSVLSDHYDYNTQAQCYLYSKEYLNEGEYEYVHFCMEVDLVDSKIINGSRYIYVATKGDQVEFNGGDVYKNDCTGCAGINGFFVYKNSGGHYIKIAQGHDESGDYGEGLDEWQLRQFAPNVWGFLAEKEFCQQGICVTYFDIAMPQGSQIVSGEIESGYNDEDTGLIGRGDVGYSDLEAALVIDQRRTVNGFYPLQLIVDGNNKGRKRYNKAVYTAIYEPSQGRYITPKNYPLRSPWK